MSRGSYLYQLSEAQSHSDDVAKKGLVLAIRRCHEGSKGRYGCRRVTMDLRNHGIVANHKAVQRIMRKTGLQGAQPKAGKGYNSFRGDVGTGAPNLPSRDFFPERPMEKFATDVSEFAIGAGKLYLSPIIDMGTKEIVAYDVSRVADLRQVKRMLGQFGSVIRRHGAARAMLHSDQGWQYRNRYYHEWLEQHNVTKSMSRKATTNDNIMIEIFFGRMKAGMFYGNEKTFRTLDELEAAIKDYIYWYNHRRICKRLNGL